MNYLAAIKKQYPGITEDHYRLKDDGSGVELEYLHPSFGEKITKEQLKALAETSVDVPKTVTKRQFMLAVHDAGFTGQLTQAIRGRNARVQIDWENRLEIDRNSQIVSALKQSIGYTEEQMDTFFVQAKNL